eukprot:CAMPEP_0197448568 /NCGR_PEP_ID=MMETSP1175-20131217/18151_1 /TAXON_ID=1003142 /ORGANISM="Triceratium dubium, Strain CCMP147" /LENGTH=103 /DNA_ID=CAMNT_0042980373 /DNA_START=465 /DNA_END=776 /DNA_ORIENTATION=-
MTGARTFVVPDRGGRVASGARALPHGPEATLSLSLGVGQHPSRQARARRPIYRRELFRSAERGGTPSQSWRVRFFLTTSSTPSAGIRARTPEKRDGVQNVNKV